MGDSKEAQIAGCISEFILSWLGRPMYDAGFCQPLSQDLLGNPDQQRLKKKGLLARKDSLVMAKMGRDTRWYCIGTFPRTQVSHLVPAEMAF